jgi:hypothetical protein
MSSNQYKLEKYLRKYKETNEMKYLDKVMYYLRGGGGECENANAFPEKDRDRYCTSNPLCKMIDKTCISTKCSDINKIINLNNKEKYCNLNTDCNLNQKCDNDGCDDICEDKPEKISLSLTPLPSRPLPPTPTPTPTINCIKPSKECNWYSFNCTNDEKKLTSIYNKCINNEKKECNEIEKLIQCRQNTLCDWNNDSKPKCRRKSLERSETNPLYEELASS